MKRSLPPQPTLSPRHYSTPNDEGVRAKVPETLYWKDALKHRRASLPSGVKLLEGGRRGSVPDTVGGESLTLRCLTNKVILFIQKRFCSIIIYDTNLHSRIISSFKYFLERKNLISCSCATLITILCERESCY